MKIGVDIMGGDFAPAATVAGSILAQKKLPTGCKIVMLGDQEVIDAELKKHKVASTTFEIVHAPDVIGMGEHPTKAFSSKPNSSIFVGFRLLKEGKIDGFASNGNSGAMMVGSMYSVKTVPGVIRPSISTILPKENGGSRCRQSFGWIRHFKSFNKVVEKSNNNGKTDRRSCGKHKFFSPFK